MKNYLLGLLLCIGSHAHAATDIIKLPIKSFAAPVAVELSSNAYTNVTAVGTRISGLTGVMIDVPASLNSGHIAFGHLGNCTSTAISTTTVKGPIELSPALAGTEVEMAEDICLWMATASTHTITVQGLTRKP